MDKISSIDLFAGVGGMRISLNRALKKLGLKESGYRLITNSGINGGQEVLHYHVHIIGGEPLGSKIK